MSAVSTTSFTYMRGVRMLKPPLIMMQSSTPPISTSSGVNLKKNYNLFDSVNNNGRMLSFVKIEFVTELFAVLEHIGWCRCVRLVYINEEIISEIYFSCRLIDNLLASFDINDPLVMCVVELWVVTYSYTENSTSLALWLIRCVSWHFWPLVDLVHPACISARVKAEMS